MAKFLRIFPVLLGILIIAAIAAGLKGHSVHVEIQEERSLALEACQLHAENLAKLTLLYCLTNDGNVFALNPNFGTLSPAPEVISALDRKLLVKSRFPMPEGIIKGGWSDMDAHYREQAQKLFDFCETQHPCELFLSPDDVKAQGGGEAPEQDHNFLITDVNYWYFPYEITNEEQGLLFVDFYKNVFSTEKNFYWDRVNGTGVSIEPIDRSIKRGLMTVYDEQKTLLAKDISGSQFVSLNRAASLAEPGNFPSGGSAYDAVLFVERPNIHGDGGHVVYNRSRGHVVEFVKYPGKFPMTEKFIAALESLDELKKLNIVRTNPN